MAAEWQTEFLRSQLEIYRLIDTTRPLVLAEQFKAELEAGPGRAVDVRRDR
jgi:hypothetical protein